MGAIIGILAGVGGLFLMWAAVTAWGWVLVLARRYRKRRQARARAAARAQAMDAAVEAIAGKLDGELARMMREWNEQRGGTDG
ncbi:MAG TPA: hypothetical protein VH372_17050 [Actinospica sp.]|jgi:hypothetical protein|nr:hypothetical protein [Actinospica sp.]